MSKCDWTTKVVVAVESHFTTKVDRGGVRRVHRFFFAVNAAANTTRKRESSGRIGHGKFKTVSFGGKTHELM